MKLLPNVRLVPRRAPGVDDRSRYEHSRPLPHPRRPDSVAEGIIPANEADDLFITVGVFIHWEAKDDKKIQEFNYRATKEALARAVKGEPKASEVTAKKDAAHHPFAAS